MAERKKRPKETNSPMNRKKRAAHIERSSSDDMVYPLWRKTGENKEPESENEDEQE